MSPQLLFLAFSIKFLLFLFFTFRQQSSSLPEVPSPPIPRAKVWKATFSFSPSDSGNHHVSPVSQSHHGVSSPHQHSCNLHSSSASFSKPRPLENVPIVIISSRYSCCFFSPADSTRQRLSPVPTTPSWSTLGAYDSTRLVRSPLHPSDSLLRPDKSGISISPLLSQFDEVAKFAYNRAHPHFSIRKAVNRQGVVSGWLRGWTVNPGAGVRLLWKTVFCFFFFSLSSSQSVRMQTRQFPSRLRVSRAHSSRCARLR